MNAVNRLIVLKEAKFPLEIRRLGVERIEEKINKGSYVDKLLEINEIGLKTVCGFLYMLEG